MNKTIHRESKTSAKIFDDRTLEKDYATLVPFLKKGLRVLDVGCGTGAISRDIAERVGPTGYVIGIDNTEAFITSGKVTYKEVSNLALFHVDLFEFSAKDKFDLIVAARVLQWLNNPVDAMLKMKSLLKPGGTLSVLDYNHTAIEWRPQPPRSMEIFYESFLRWRAAAGMNNAMAEDLEDYFTQLEFQQVEAYPANEIYKKGDANFIQRIGIWSKVAGLKQIADEGYVENELRLKAIEEYNHWIESDAECMTMKLNEVRGRI